MDNIELLSVIIRPGFSLTINASIWFVSIVIIIIVIVVSARYLFRFNGTWKTFEIDEAEFGIGDQKIRIRPNDIDRQIAFKIWVELSTRKIGIPIDLDHDVVIEIYNSWYSFFGITRDLIKDVPVSKFKRKDTEQIIKLSIDVLNSGIRPHLTQWQARFRRWYDNQLSKSENSNLHPQQIQKEYPEFPQLEADILDVNKRLIRYREQMYRLIIGV